MPIVLMRRAIVLTATAVITPAVLHGAARATTDTVFRYSSPRVGHYSIHRLGMSPTDSSTTYFSTATANSDGLATTGGTSGCFAAHVHLPQAATITNVMIWYKSSNAASSPQTILYRHRLSTDLDEQVAAVTFTDQSNMRKATNLAPNAGLEVIDNARYMYALMFCVNGSTASFYGARIDYTYTTAGD